MGKPILCRFSIHKMDSWKFAKPDSCEEIRICVRCSDKRETRIRHVWEPWKYENETIHVRVCSRDGAKEKERHIYEVCQECGGGGGWMQAGGGTDHESWVDCGSCSGGGREGICEVCG